MAKARASTKAKKGAEKNQKLRWGVIIALVVLAIAAIQWLPVGEWVKSLQDWIEGAGAWGPVLYFVTYVLLCLVFVPAWPLTLAAGALFGLGWGMLLASLSATTVATLAFLIARTVAHARFERMAKSYPRFEAIRKGIGEDGWKMVLLVRLSPIVPFNLANYLFGLTRVDLWPYVASSWIGMLPGAFLYVYLGHLGGEGARGGSKRPGEWALLGVGLVASVVAATWMARLARGALDKKSGAHKAA